MVPSGLVLGMGYEGRADAATFAANFDQKENFNNAQDKEGMADLMDSLSG